MSFVAHYFDKTVGDLEFSEIQRLVETNTPESQTLEFKSGEVRFADCGKTISAFLNTDGGLLLIGMPRTETIDLDDGGRARLCRGEFHLVEPAPDKDDAHRRLLSRIQPIPTGVAVHIVPSGDVGAVVSVDVAKSHYPPHQYDNAYYVRLDGETRKAPQAFVEALFLQRRGPNLECRVIAERIRPVDSDDDNDRFDVRLRFEVVNNSRSIAEYVACDLKVDPGVEAGNPGFGIDDQQPDDTTLPVTQDQAGQRLYRYRQRGWVTFGYSYKTFRAAYRVRPRIAVEFVVASQTCLSLVNSRTSVKRRRVTSTFSKIRPRPS